MTATVKYVFESLVEHFPTGQPSGTLRIRMSELLLAKVSLWEVKSLLISDAFTDR